MLPPRDIAQTKDLLGRHLEHANVKDGCRNDEHSEKQDLDNEAAYDDPLPCLAGGRRVARGHDAAAASLHEEREDVPGNEDLGEPFSADQGVFFAVGEQDDAA